jgi:hypothetical protein
MIDTSGILHIGDKTKWGRVGGIALICGERYYFLVSKTGVVSMMPSAVVKKP